MLDIASAKISVIGLGYVGLPLVVEFGKQVETIGFDIDEQRIAELNSGCDKTNELTKEEVLSSTHLRFTSNKEDLRSSNVYIVTVPTPIDDSHQPDLTPLKNASRLIGEVISKGDIVIYESTVYPGATEEECIPVIELVSGLEFNDGFYAGYSPERLNPGDKEHSVTSIKKVTSGSTPETAEFVDSLYQSIIIAGTHKAPSIRVAEAAKVIENTQRDLNIALVNELAMIFNRLDINTHDVLEAASTKWNFLNFKPGLVGGHCIGIDPYYLTYKAESSGYHPDVILAGRKINDGMGKYVVSRLVREMIRRCIHINGSRILVMGLAFKENCSDIRNTKVVDIIDELKDYNAEVDVYDPIVDKSDAKNKFDIELKEKIEFNRYDAVVIAVGHDSFKDISVDLIDALGKENFVLFDVKNIINVKHRKVLTL